MMLKQKRGKAGAKRATFGKKAQRNHASRVLCVKRTSLSRRIATPPGTRIAKKLSTPPPWSTGSLACAGLWDFITMLEQRNANVALLTSMHSIQPAFCVQITLTANMS
jgi:hypothetical protein